MAAKDAVPAPERVVVVVVVERIARQIGCLILLPNLSPVGDSLFFLSSSYSFSRVIQEASEKKSDLPIKMYG